MITIRFTQDYTNKTVITKSSVRNTGLSFNWDIYISTDYRESEGYLCDQKNLHFIGKQTSAE